MCLRQGHPSWSGGFDGALPECMLYTLERKTDSFLRTGDRAGRVLFDALGAHPRRPPLAPREGGGRPPIIRTRSRARSNYLAPRGNSRVGAGSEHGRSSAGGAIVCSEACSEK